MKFKIGDNIKVTKGQHLDCVGRILEISTLISGWYILSIKGYRVTLPEDAMELT